MSVRRAALVKVEPLEGRALMALMVSGLAIHAAAAQRAASVGRRDPRNLVYTAADDPGPQRLDLYRPPGEPPAGGWPVVLAIHGGGWRKFSKEQYAPKVVPALTREGFAVVAPNYVLAGPGRPSWPENLDQLRQAVVWVKSHANEYGLDPTRIAAMGESAGGHLAALLGTRPLAGQDDPARIGAVVSFFGPADLAALAENSPAGYAAARQMIGTDASLDPARYADASPTELASPGDAPTLIFQGAADPLVPPDQAEGLADALSNAGVTNQLVLIRGAGHGFGLRVRGQDLTPTIADFLRDALGLPAEAVRRPRR